MIEVCAFWAKTSKEGKNYFSGKDEFHHRYFLFEVVSENSKAPSFRLCREDPSSSKQQKPKQATLATASQSDDLGI